MKKSCRNCTGKGKAVAVRDSEKACSVGGIGGRRGVRP